MGYSSDTLDPIESVTRRKDPYEKWLGRWAEYDQQFQIDIKNGKEIDECEATDNITVVAQHLLGKHCHNAETSLSNSFTESKIKKLKALQDPSVAQKITLAASTLAKVLAAGIAIIPAAAGTSQATSSIIQQASSLVDGVGGRGGESVLGMIRDTNQATATAYSQAMEQEKRTMEAMRHANQMTESQMRRALENQASKQDKKFNTVRSLTGSF